MRRSRAVATQLALVQTCACNAGCDVSFLCAKQPALFFGTADQDLESIASSYELLQVSLPGLDIDDLVTQHTSLLFMTTGCLQEALQQFHDLWSDPGALCESDPFEVGLALRALSPTGPPRRF